MSRSRSGVAATADRFSWRTVLSGFAVTGLGLFAGCLPNPSSGGPSSESHELDDCAVFEPALRVMAGRAYYAGLVTGGAGSELFDWQQENDAAREFVENTNFDEAYLGVVQVGAVDPSVEFAVVDIAESEVNVTVVLDASGATTPSDDRVITTLLVRVLNGGSNAPDQIAVELDIGDRHETFTGEQTG